MAIQIDDTRVLFGEPIKITDKVSLRIPKVGDVALNTNFSQYSRLFCVSTRELFSAMREVDELEKKYPTVFDMMFDDDQTDYALGTMLGSGLPASALVMEALEFWTGADRNGFAKLSNGKKFVHEKQDWVIDKAMFEDICEVIKKLLCYEPDIDLIAPEIRSDARFDAWQKTLKGRLRSRSRKGATYADKILILSISMDSYIPIQEIREMSIFHFTKMYNAVHEKEAYERSWAVHISPKFDTSKQKIQHWSEKVSK